LTPRSNIHWQSANSPPADSGTQGTTNKGCNWQGLPTALFKNGNQKLRDQLCNDWKTGLWQFRNTGPDLKSMGPAQARGLVWKMSQQLTLYLLQTVKETIKNAF
jgi:hypothetical protein